MVEKPDIDEVDWAILGLLAENARMPVSTIAKNLRISREVAKYRLKKLVMDGSIKAFVTWPDLTKIGYPIYGYMHIRFKDLTTKREKEFIDYVKADHNIPFACSNLGSWDFAVEFLAQTPRHFYDLQRKVMEKFSDIVKDYETGSFMEIHKMNYVPKPTALKIRIQHT